MAAGRPCRPKRSREQIALKHPNRLREMHLRLLELAGPQAGRAEVEVDGNLQRHVVDGSGDVERALAPSVGLLARCRSRGNGGRSRSTLAQDAIDRRAPTPTARRPRGACGRPRSRPAGRASCAGRAEDRSHCSRVSRVSGRCASADQRLLEVGLGFPMRRPVQRARAGLRRDSAPPSPIVSPRNAWWARRSTCSVSRSE